MRYLPWRICLAKWCIADPGRVTNLLSNGIRFTSNSTVRRIELRFDVSFDPPTEGTCVMPGLPDPLAPGQLRDDMDIYLYVAVKDTGPGLTAKELDMLFQRFSQVSREFRRPLFTALRNELTRQQRHILFSEAPVWAYLFVERSPSSVSLLLVCMRCVWNVLRNISGRPHRSRIRAR